MPSDAPTAFFSYSREDLEFALRLAKDLKKAGASVWMDKLDIRAGQLWERKVEEALTNCPRLLVILTPSSVNSPQVMAEVAFALDEQKEVIPVLYRDCKIPYRLRPVQRVDFRSDYAAAFEELLASIGVEQPAERSELKAPVPVGGQPELPTAAERIAKGTPEEVQKQAADEARLEQEERSAAEKARLELKERERQAAERSRSEEKERAMQAAAARARGDYSRVEIGSSPEGSFVYSKFSPTVVKVAIAAGVLVIALLIYLAVRPKPQGGGLTDVPAAASSSAPSTETSAKEPVSKPQDAPEKRVEGSPATPKKRQAGREIENAPANVAKSVGDSASAPEPKAATPTRVRVSQGVSQGLLIHKVPPVYPPLARQARISGTVVLHAVIGEDGTIQTLNVVSGHPMLTNAALEAVQQWRYKPYFLFGNPVEVETTINVNFTLAGD